jgi:hypothetical protein
MDGAGTGSCPLAGESSGSETRLFVCLLMKWKAESGAINRKWEDVENKEEN